MITVKGILLEMSIFVIVFAGYMLTHRSGNARFLSGSFYSIMSAMFFPAVIAGGFVIAACATRLRILAIAGGVLALLCVVSMAVADKIWGGSMGSYGWILGFNSIIYLIPLALLCCVVAGIVSLVSIIQLHAAARIPMLLVGMFLLPGSVLLGSRMNAPPNIERMLQSLREANSTGRLEIIHLLGGIEDRRITAPLIRIFQDTQEEWYVRSSAVRALGKQAGDSRIVAPLLEAAHEDNLDIQEGAIFSLGQVVRVTGTQNDSRPFDALIQFLQHPEERLRVAAVQSLGWIDTEQVIPWLIDTLRDKSLLVRYHAHEHLIRITDSDVGEHVEQWQSWYENSL